MALLTSLRLAWRDLWAQGRRSLFFALLVAAGVASLVGVQGAARATAEGVRTSARQVLQGDLQIVRGAELTPAQAMALEDLRQEGAEVTEVFEILSTVMSESGAARTNVEVKAVDPNAWPYYGGFATGSGEALADLLASGDDAVVAPEVLDRLGLAVGDSVRMGDRRLRIRGTIAQEPRNFGSGQIPLAPRIIIRADAHRALAEHEASRYDLVKLPIGTDAAAAAKGLSAAFPASGAVQTYDEAGKSFAKVMENVFTFLSLIALVSLLVGGLGVAMAMRTFIQQKMEHIAVLKALGASSGRVMSIFLVEAAALGAGGSLIGAALGLGVQAMLPAFINQVIPMPETGINLTATVGGFAAGTLTAVVCALLPIRAVRHIKPTALFRGETGPVRRGWRAFAETAGFGALVLSGVGAMAVRYAGSTKLGLGFVGAMAAVAVVLALISWVLLKLMRLLPQSGLPTVRHAVRSIGAPGNQAGAAVVAMGMGLTLIMAVYLVQVSLVGQLRAAGVSADVPNLYVAGVAPEKRSEVRAYLQEHEGVARVLDPLTVLTAEFAAVDGRSAGELALPASLNRPFPIMATGFAVPNGYTMAEGEWLTPADAGRNVAVLERKTAEQLGVAVGSKVVVRIKGDEVELAVKGIYAPSQKGAVVSSLGLLSIPHGSLDAYADSYAMQAVTKPGREGAVVTDMLARFPGMMTLGLRDLMDLINGYLGKVANLLRFITGFAVVAAGVILSGSLSATRFRRRKEAALLKALGATRLTVAAASALENGLLGAVAGLAGGGLGYGALAAITLALKVPAVGALGPVAGAALGGALLAVVVGLASTVDVFRVRPMAILRGE